MKYTFHDRCSILPRNHKSVQKPKEQEAKTTKAKKNKKLRSREDKSRKSHESNKSQTSQKTVNKSQKNYKSHKSNKTGKVTTATKATKAKKPDWKTKKRPSNFPTSSINWKDIVQLMQDQSSRPKLLSGWTHPTLAFGFSCATSALGFSISSCRNQIHFHVFDDMTSLKHFGGLKSTQAYISLHATAICKRYRKISKESPMVKGITHKKSEQSVSHTMPHVLPCFWLL